MTAADRLVTRGFHDTVATVRRARRKVESTVRSHRGESPGELLARVRRVLQRSQPELFRAIEGGIVASWIAAALDPARDAAPRMEDPRELPDPFPPSPPFGVLPLAPPGDDAETPVRWPALDASARDLLSRQVVTTADFLTLGEDARAAAYTVANRVTQDATEAVQDAVASEVLRGGGLRGFRQSVGQALESAGMSDSQVEAIYRTHTGLARAAGMQTVLAHPLIGGEFPYVAYNAIHDGRTRPEHAKLERLGIQGTNVYRADDPVILKYWPPWAWNCRCNLQHYTIEDAAAKGIHEARVWLRTGEPPVRPTWVADPNFKVPADWPRRDGRVRAAV